MKKSTLLLSLFAILAINFPVQLQGQATEAEWVEYSVRTPIPRRNLKLPPSGTEYYVSLKGNDQNPGTREKPFRNIQKFADIAQPGDLCLVREGTYREIVRPKNSGRTGDPIRYVAYPGEKVTISGTEAITGKWSKYKGSIYQTRLDMNCEQLFVDGEMMIEARWPNMRFEELWERSCWANAGPESRYGRMVDPELAKTDVDWTGAIATLNVAHQFNTWTRKVSKHSKGSDTFEYPRDLGGLSNTADTVNRWQDDYYYLSGKLGALDIPTEWFYDTEARTLYLWTPDGESPANHSIEVKVRDIAFDVKDLDEIHLIGFNFYACTFQFENSVHSLVDDCHLLFPTYSRELSDSRDGGGITVTRMSGSYNIIRNSTLGYTPLSGLVMTGPYNTLDNNLVHDVCWGGSLGYPAISMGSDQENPGSVWNASMIRGNTVYNAGSAGIGFRGQAYNIEYNYVHHCGMLSHDVAAIYTGGSSISGSIVRYNWVHNCHPEIENNKNIGLGIRGDDHTMNMSVHHNVIWDVGLEAIIMKGEFNEVYNNTVFHTKPELKFGNAIRMDTEPEPNKEWRTDPPLLGEQNAHSLVFNNVVGIIRAEYHKDTPFIQRSNVIHNLLDYEPELRDPENFDFRPKEGSNLIDAGIAIYRLTDSFEGEAPDIGAYEHGGVFWKPGYQAKAALFYQNNTAYDKITD